MQYHLLALIIYHVLELSLQDEYFEDITIPEDTKYGLYELKNLNLTKGKIRFEGFWEESAANKDEPAPQIKFFFMDTDTIKVVDAVYVKPRRNTENFSRGFWIDFYIRNGLIEIAKLRPDTYRVWCCNKNLKKETSSGSIRHVKIVGAGPRFVMFRFIHGKEIYEIWHGMVETTERTSREYHMFKDDNICDVKYPRIKHIADIGLTNADEYEAL